MDQDALRITKIAYAPPKKGAGGRVRIEWNVVNGDEEADEYSIATREPPHPELVAALGALRRHVILLCELEGIGDEDLEVRGVTITWKHDVMGAVITGLRKLSRSSSPLVLNTPHKTVAHYGEDGDDSQLLPESTIGALEDLIVEARAFVVDGKRGAKPDKPQLELEVGDAERGHRGRILEAV